MDRQFEDRLTSAAAEDVDAVMRRLTRRSFVTGAAAAALGGLGVSWIASAPDDGGIPWPLRRMLRFNERIARAAFSDRRLAPEFDRAAAGEPRVNGLVGLATEVASDNWAVRVVGAAERLVPLAAVKELPTYEMTAEFKCVEGWSQVVNWRGVRLSDFLQKFGVASPYVGLSTPFDAVDDSGRPDRYFVGLDQSSAVHPQTLLCFEMNGQPLSAGHGGPLRLVSTVKYGYKNIKRVSVISLTDSRPADYWAARGYDWYGGL
ncbi:MAG: molybdopterin-dependent oxidoreductase [Pirellulales bacterium]